MLRVCVVLCRCFYCYCIIVQTAQDRQGTVHARVCYCYRLVLDNTETHYHVHWAPACAILGQIRVPRRAQTRPTKQENQIAAICVAAYERQCTGGLRMIIGGGGNKKLPVLSAGWSFWILLARSIASKSSWSVDSNWGHQSYVVRCGE